MIREHSLDKVPALRRQKHPHHAMILFQPFPAHPPLPLEVIHDQSDVPAAPQQLLAQCPLAHRPEMQQCLQDSELAHGEPILSELRAHAPKY